MILEHLLQGLAAGSVDFNVLLIATSSDMMIAVRITTTLTMRDAT